MADDESPDHAGLRADARKIRYLVNDAETYEEKQEIIEQFASDCYAAGRAYGVASQEAELATLRSDRARLNDEVNALSGQVRDNDDLIERLKLMVSYRNDKLAVLLCDCGTSTLMPDKRKAMIYHQYECAYRKFVAKREGEPVEAK